MSVLLIFQAPQIRAITAIQLETLRCLGKIFIFCACLSLCSLQTLASETKLPELITGVKCERLLQLIPGQLSADNHGIIITLPRKKGICKKFQLAVYSSSGDALNIWNNSKPPQGAQASVLLGTGGQVKYWLNSDEATSHVVMLTNNVLSEYDWWGPIEKAGVFVNQFREALQTENDLATRGPYVNLPETEVILPDFVEAGHSFPILYRIPDGSFVAMGTSVELRHRGEYQPSNLQLSGDVNFASSGRMIASWPLPGSITLLLTFVSTNCVVYHKSYDIDLQISLKSAAYFPKVSNWELPDHAIYFSSNPHLNWNPRSKYQQEHIQLLDPSGYCLRQLSANDAAWERLHAWNIAESVVKHDWLPSLPLFQVFQDISLSAKGRDIVACAAYTRNKDHIVILMEPGHELWIYIEQSASLPNHDAGLSPTDILNSTFEKSRETSIMNNALPISSYMARTYHRYRMLKQDGLGIPVRILLIHVLDKTQVNLRYPGNF